MFDLDNNIFIRRNEQFFQIYLHENQKSNVRFVIISILSCEYHE
jgi:hypothetical protein